jgi:hypothetical protein
MNPDNSQESTNAPLQPDNKQEQDNQTKSDPSDNLTPDHPRFKEVVAEKNELKQTVNQLQSQMEELRQSISTRQSREDDDSLTYEEQQALDRIDRGLKAKGYLTEEDLRSRNRAENYKSLTKEYDGKNGLPKFVPIEVEAHAKANGYGDNLLAAYRDMHFDAIVQQESKRSANQPEVPTSEKPASGQRGNVANTEFTPEAISQMSDEEYERNREKILGSIRSSTRS